MNNPNSEPYSYLTDTTVVRLDEPGSINFLGITDKMFMFEQLLRAIVKQCTNSEGYQQQWLEQGVSCSVLVPGKDWQRGNLKIRIEFTPEIPETSEPADTSDSPSPLDDIRQTLINP